MAVVRDIVREVVRPVVNPVNERYFNWPAYWARHLDLWYKSRSGNDFIEFYTDNAFPAKILSMTMSCDGTHYMQAAVANFRSTVTAGYIESRCYYDGNVGQLYVFTSCDQVLVTKMFSIRIIAGKPSFNIQNVGTANYVETTNAISIGWHTIRWISSGTAYSMIIDGGTILTVGAGLSVITGSNNGDWIGDVADRDNIAIGVMRRSTYSYSTSGYIDYVDFNGTNKWILTGYGKYQYDVLAGQTMTLTPLGGLLKYVYGAGSHLFDVGHAIWTKAGQYSEFVPYVSTGVPYDPSALLVGYANSGNRAGDLVNLIKYAPVLIGFNETGDADSRLAIFDRSNTTRQEDISRASSYYDATSLATKCRYYSSEILYIATVESYFKTGYKHRIFPINNDLLNPTAISGFMIAKEDMA